MKKVIVFLVLTGVAGLSVYYLKPEMFAKTAVIEPEGVKQAGAVVESLEVTTERAVQLSGAENTSAGMPAAKTGTRSYIEPCKSCEKGYVKCTGCKGKGFPLKGKCDSCRREARLVFDKNTQGFEVICGACGINYGNRDLYKCKICGGEGRMKCKKCKGVGLFSFSVKYVENGTKDCPRCKKTGMVDCPKLIKVVKDMVQPGLVPGKGTGSGQEYNIISCPECQGQGRKNCPDCGGHGYITAKGN